MCECPGNHPAEVKLPKQKLRAEIAKALSSLAWLIAGAISGLFAIGFALWTITYALALIWPIWASLIAITTVLAVGAAMLIVTGKKRITRVQCGAGTDARDHEGKRGMDKTVDQIEARIDRKRSELGSNIQELERRVDAVTDWQQQFRSRPFVFLGVAATCGALAAAALGRKHSGRGLAGPAAGLVSVSERRSLTRALTFGTM